MPDEWNGILTNSFVQNKAGVSQMKIVIQFYFIALECFEYILNQNLKEFVQRLSLMNGGGELA